MPSVLAYHRPETLNEAAALTASGARAVAGGTVVVPDALIQRETGTELVDLQALGLDGIEPGDATLTVGAMVRLSDLMTDPAVPALVQQLARLELPSALRNQATVGGTVGDNDAESVLLAGLLVHGAVVKLHSESDKPLADVLRDGLDGAIITGLTIETDGTGAIAATGRTPADVPIVSAVARRTGGAGVRLALTGVAATVVEVDPTSPAEGLEPPSDFRGSPKYRRHLAATLGARAVEEVGS